MHFPTLRAGQACPVSPGVTIEAGGFAGFAYGNGLVRPLTAGKDVIAYRGNADHPWLAFKTLWFSVPAYQGPFLVRAHRIDGPGPIGLAHDPSTSMMFVPAGPTINGTDGYREATGATWVMKPGCLAWQVDGMTFSDVIVVLARSG